MSVPKNKRSHCKLEPIVKAQELAKHTLLVTNNEKKFTQPYRILTFNIVNTANQIFIDSYTANNIYVKSKETYAKRIEFQTNAILNTHNLLALIDLAYSCFHLRSSQIEYWIKLVIETREGLVKWRKSDKERYNQYK